MNASKQPKFLLLLLLNLGALGAWHVSLKSSIETRAEARVQHLVARQLATTNASLPEIADSLERSSVQARNENPVIARRRRQEFGTNRHRFGHGSAHDGSDHQRPPLVADEPKLGQSDSCEVCVATPDDPMCQEYGLDNVRLSRNYVGSGTRVRRVLDKALRGEKIKIGVIGGSVTLGHGIWPQRNEESWVDRFVRHFKQQFPNTEVENGAMAATGSDFFQYCWDAKIADDADLYLVELEINDVYHDETYAYVDRLTRSILGLPQQPALIRVGTVATSFPNMLMGLSASLTLSTYFDTPYIGIRNFMLPHFMEHPSKSAEFFAVFPDSKPDYRHIAKWGHRALADMLTLYIREQTCETKKREQFGVVAASGRWPKADILGKVPRLYIWEPFSASKKVSPVHSFCSFFGSRRELVPDTELTDPAWERVEWNNKAASRCDEPGKRIGFRFKGTRVGLFVYMRNAATQGKLRCWVDDDRSQSVDLDARWDRASQPEFRLVRKDLDYGHHTLTCHVLPSESADRGTEVRIFGFAST